MTLESSLKNRVKKLEKANKPPGKTGPDRIYLVPVDSEGEGEPVLYWERGKVNENI